MQKAAEKPAEKMPELVPLNIIRVETALSRYPVHRLAKHGSIAIEIREESDDGEVLIRWEVDSSKKYGQPGPLAYKVDTLIVNRRIDEASRPIPRIICLGSLKEIAEQLRLGGDTNKVKKAFRQNAFAGIVAKFRYRASDGTKRTLEADFTRYHVVFTGEELPDGRKADAVYLVLNDIYMQVLNRAQTRPLDYDYLKDLPPASQRLYEILSFQMYAALKYGRRQARLAYSEFCTYAPLTRHFEWFRVRNQMNKIHRPHLKSGYIERVEFEQTADRDGNPDWLMVYVPGFKAKAEYRAFTKRGRPQVLDIEEPSLALPPPTGPTPLERELIDRGVTASTARELVAAYPEARIAAQIEYFDWLREHGPKKVQANPGGYLASAVRGDYASPKGFESRAERAKRLEAEEAKRRREQEEARRRKAEQSREDAAQAKILKYWRALSPDEQQRLEAEALEQAEEAVVAGYREMQAKRNPLAPSALRCIREAHIRKLLGLASPSPLPQ